MLDGSGATPYSYTSGGFLMTDKGPFTKDVVTNNYTSRSREGISHGQPTTGACSLPQRRGRGIFVEKRASKPCKPRRGGISLGERPNISLLTELEILCKRFSTKIPPPTALGYDGNRVIQERAANNTALTGYTSGNDLSGSLEGAGGIGGMLARSDSYSSGSFTNHDYYHADGNGNITYLETPAQGLAASYRYDPFGNLISSTGTLAAANTYRFSSKEWVPGVGVYAYLYRFYDPSLQRWINRDPIQEKGGINQYESSGNNMLSLVDAFGRDPSNGGDTGLFTFLKQSAGCANSNKPLLNKDTSALVGLVASVADDSTQDKVSPTTPSPVTTPPTPPQPNPNPLPPSPPTPSPQQPQLQPYQPNDSTDNNDNNDSNPVVPNTFYPYNTQPKVISIPLKNSNQIITIYPPSNISYRGFTIIW